MSEERKKNVSEARDTFEFFAASVKSFAESVSWAPQKNREERTKLVLALMSYWRLLREEYVFLNTKHLKGVLDSWKDWKNQVEEKDYEELISKWIHIYIKND